MTELPSEYEVENQLRSIAMLTVGQPALNREQAMRLLEQLAMAVREMERGT